MVDWLLIGNKIYSMHFITHTSLQALCYRHFIRGALVEVPYLMHFVENILVWSIAICIFRTL